MAQDKSVLDKDMCAPCVNTHGPSEELLWLREYKAKTQDTEVPATRAVGTKGASRAPSRAPNSAGTAG